MAKMSLMFSKDVISEKIIEIIKKYPLEGGILHHYENGLLIIDCFDY